MSERRRWNLAGRAVGELTALAGDLDFGFEDEVESQALLDDPQYLYFLGRHASLESLRLEYCDGVEDAAVPIREMLATRAGS